MSCITRGNSSSIPPDPFCTGAEIVGFTVAEAGPGAAERVDCPCKLNAAPPIADDGLEREADPTLLLDDTIPPPLGEFPYNDEPPIMSDIVNI